MKKIIYMLMLLVVYCCQSNDDEIKPSRRGIHDGSAWEYFTSGQPGTWDSLVVAIRYTGLEILFDGSQKEYAELTIFGCTNHSFRNYLFNGGYERISDIPREECRNMLLSYIIKGKRLMQTFPYEIKGTMEGGDIHESLAGQELRIYLVQHDLQGIPGAGMDKLTFESENGFIVTVASSNIQTDNAVIHSLETLHVFGEI